jgi:type II secretory pathway component PulF
MLQGRPFMESLTENRALLYSLLGSGGAVLALAMGLVPDFASQFEIVDFPPEVTEFLPQTSKFLMHPLFPLVSICLASSAVRRFWTSVAGRSSVLVVVRRGKT